MSDDSKLRLVLRGYTIASDVSLEDGGGEQFVAVAKPPPVGATLEALDGQHRRLVEVARVVESEGTGSGRGFFGRVHDGDDTLLRRVGSENLAPGEPAAPAESGGDVMEDREMSASYPVPAPVLDSEPSEPIDVGYAGGQPAAAAPAAAEEPAAAAEEAAPEESAAEESAAEESAAEESAAEESAAGDAGDDKPKGRGKKRKGRKRG